MPLSTRHALSEHLGRTLEVDEQGLDAVARRRGGETVREDVREGRGVEACEHTITIVNNKISQLAWTIERDDY